jgi:transcriptional regulator with XRE-family HTH domain
MSDAAADEPYTHVDSAGRGLVVGFRLREVRTRNGLSVRGVARKLGVSPSFISQLENGKSQPSVATLYLFAQLLDVTMEELFEQESPADGARFPEAVPHPGRPGPGFTHLIRADRPRLVLDSGVVWEQLASTADAEFDLVEVTYPQGSHSSIDGRMLRHQGYEYAYLVEGELQILVGFEGFVLKAGESMTLDSSMPHLFTNLGTGAARGIWCVHRGARSSAVRPEMYSSTRQMCAPSVQFPETSR